MSRQCFVGERRGASIPGCLQMGELEGYAAVRPESDGEFVTGTLGQKRVPAMYARSHPASATHVRRGAAINHGLPARAEGRLDEAGHVDVCLKDIATHSHLGHTECWQTGILSWTRSWRLSLALSHGSSRCVARDVPICLGTKRVRCTLQAFQRLATITSLSGPCVWPCYLPMVQKSYLDCWRDLASVSRMPSCFSAEGPPLL